MSTILSNENPEAYVGEFGDSINMDLRQKILCRRNKPNAYISPKPSEVLRVATWNVHNWKTVCDEKPRKNVAQFLEHIGQLQADIICLQEVVPTARISRSTRTRPIDWNYVELHKMMRQLGYSHNYIDETVEDGTYLLANAIYSKLPMSDHWTHRLSPTRIVIGATVQYMGQSYIIANTHLNTDDTAAAEVAVLLEHMRTRQSRHPIILCGDFNRPFSSDVREANMHKKRLADGGANILDPLLSICKKINPRIVTNNLMNNLVTDYIMLSKHNRLNTLRYSVVNRVISDHLATYTDLYNRVPGALKRMVFLENVLKFDEMYAEDPVARLLQEDYYTDTDKWYMPANVAPIRGRSSRKSATPDILNYVMSHDRCNIITIYPNGFAASKSAKKMADTVKLLEQYGIVVNVKEHEVDEQAFLRLIFQLYLYQPWAKSMHELVDYAEQCATANKSGKVASIVFELSPDHSLDILRGRKAMLKEQVREIWGHEGRYKVVHIHDTYYEAIQYAKLYYHGPSWQMMKLTNLQNLLYLLRDRRCYIMMNTLRRVLYENFSSEFIDKFIVASSMMLYVLGMRLFNDIDGFVMADAPVAEYEQYVNYFVGRKWLSAEQQATYVQRHWLPFTDFQWLDKPESGFQPYVREHYDKYARIIGNKSIDTMMSNPRHYFYMFGFKFPILQFEIVKRLYRYKPASWADLYAMDSMLGVKVDFPQIPTQLSHYYKSHVDKPEDFAKMIVSYLVKRYNMRNVSPANIMARIQRVSLNKREHVSKVRRLIHIRLSSTTTSNRNGTFR